MLLVSVEVDGESKVQLDKPGVFSRRTGTMRGLGISSIQMTAVNTNASLSKEIYGVQHHEINVDIPPQ